MIRDGVLWGRRVPDGLVLENLAPGTYFCSSEMLQGLEEVARDGGLYPYKLWVYSYCKAHDIYTILITED